MTHRPRALSLLLAGLVVVGCTPAAASTGTGVADPGCALMPSIRAAFADATRAHDAVSAGGKSDYLAAAESARAKAEVAVGSVASPRPSPTTALLVRAELALLGIEQFGAFLAVSYDPKRNSQAEIDATFLTLEQSVGTVEAIATTAFEGSPPACPGLAPLAVILPTMAPLPTPSDGPAPSGSIDGQRAGALAALHFSPASGITFDAGGRLRWQATGAYAVNAIFDNRTGGTVSIPFEPTILRWTGSAWQLEPCDLPDAADPATGLCAMRSNMQVMPSGRSGSTTSPSLIFTWMAASSPPPGTYALILPVWQPADELPDTPPPAAAVAILTLTSAP